MMNFIMMVSIVLTTVFAQESLVGRKVVFDHNGVRQMATIGAKTVVDGDKKTVVVSWFEPGKSFGKNAPRPVKVDLNNPNVFTEVASLPLTFEGKKIDLTKGQTVIGKDNNVYEVVAVFKNGEVGLRPFEIEYGKLKPKILTVVHTSDFIETVSQKCIGRVCPNARVAVEQGEQSFKLCPIQPVGYYRKYSLKENKSDHAECNSIEGKKSQVVSHVFMDGTVIADGQIHRRVLAQDVVVESPAGNVL